MTPTPQTTIKLLISIPCGLLALSMLLIGPHQHIALATDFYQLSELIPANISNIIASIALLACSLLAIVTIKQPKHNDKLAYALIITSIVPLITLLANTMWIDSLGGFPVIGSGQGVIKYFALLSIGILLLKPQLSAKTSAWIALIPVLIVLLWIGGMKFTLLEAKGIEDLVATSPFMGWLYNVFSLQATSNIIGVYDLVAVLLLILSMFYKQLAYLAILMSGMVFVVTQTFLVTFTPSLSTDTILTTTGHFLIKDLWFIANLVGFHYFWQKSLTDKAPKPKTLKL